MNVDPVVFDAARFQSIGVDGTATLCLRLTGTCYITRQHKMIALYNLFSYHITMYTQCMYTLNVLLYILNPPCFRNTSSTSVCVCMFEISGHICALVKS